MKFLLFMLITLMSLNLVASEGISTLSKNDTKTLKSIYKVNDDLHGAFFDFNEAKVRKVSKKLHELFNKLNDKALKEKLKFSVGKLKEMTGKIKREKYNENYHILSSAMIYVNTKYKVSTDYQAYYCPMLKKKWIQDITKTEEVENPYAPQMPQCGAQYK